MKKRREKTRKKIRCGYFILGTFSLAVALILISGCRPLEKPVLEKRGAVPQREFDLIEKKDEAYFSQKLSSDIEKETELIKKAELTDYLNRLGQRLISASRFRAYAEGYEWSFKLYDSVYANAFSLLGGKVYVSCNLVEATENESELAGILAYEIAHLMARNLHAHLSQEILKKGEISPGEMISGETGLQSIYRIFKDRKQVLNYFSNLVYYAEEIIQADKIALITLFDAGFTPQNYVDLLNRLWEEERNKPSFLWLKRNPWSERRKKEARLSLAELPSPFVSEDSPEYSQLKKELERLALPPILVDEEISLPDYVMFHRVKVPGNVDWTDSGLNVVEGQEISFQASGGISLQVGNPLAECGPDGYNRRTLQQPLPERNIGALIGKVVYLISIEVDEETGEEIRNEIVEKFYIGSQSKVVMPISGRLYLGINENVVGDNEGEFVVKILLSKKNRP